MSTTSEVGDKASVISLVPYPIKQEFPGCTPPWVTVPAAEDDNIAIKTVGESLSFLYAGHTIGNIKQYDSAISLARSIVEDFIRATMFATDEAHPGVFYVPGSWEGKESVAKVEFKREIALQSEAQKYWFQALVKVADDDWSQYHQHRMISDVQRLAARKLNLERDWATDVRFDETTRCPACSAVILPTVAICHNCRCIVNEDKFKKLKFASTPPTAG